MPGHPADGAVGHGAIVDEAQVARARDLLGDRLRHIALPTGHCVRREARAEVEAVVLDAPQEADARTAPRPGAAEALSRLSRS